MDYESQRARLTGPRRCVAAMLVSVMAWCSVSVLAREMAPDPEPEARVEITPRAGPGGGEAAGMAVDESAGTPFDPDLQRLAAEFFDWRAHQRPVFPAGACTDRPAGWLPAGSPGDLAISRVMYREFLERLEGLDRSGFTRTDETDARLLAAAIKRVGWELDAVRMPHRNPLFHVDQAIGPIVPLLLDEGAPDLPELTRRFHHIPQMLSHAAEHLDDPVQSLATAAVERITGIEHALAGLLETRDPDTDDEAWTLLSTAIGNALRSFGDYRRELQRALPAMSGRAAVGRDAYQWYLAHVALVPMTPEELAEAAEQVLVEDEAADALHRHRFGDVPLGPLPGSVEKLAVAVDYYRQELRTFLDGRELLSLPPEPPDYRVAPVPAGLEGLAPWDGLPGTPYVGPTAGGLTDRVGPMTEDPPFFTAVAARDPRLLLVGRALPGRLFQHIRARSHPDPVRAVCSEIAPHAGIAAWFEDAIRGAGLWDLSPQSAPLLARLRRLRALLAIADVRVASGEWSVLETADALTERVPMDRTTAGTLALSVAADPGRAARAFSGRLQIAAYVAAERQRHGDGFDLKAFHDRLLHNANVPVALQQWERLEDDGFGRLESLGRSRATVPR